LYLEKDIKVGSKQLELIGKLGDNTGASAIITDLLLQNPQTLGTSGAVKLFGSRLASVVGAVKDIGKDVSYKDIIDINTGKVVSGEEAARMQGLEKSVDKNIEAMFGQMDDKTRQTLAANGVRAETLKYFLANAFKSEDRLTNRDLEFIGKITNVLAFTKGGALVQAELKEIQTYLDKKRETFIRQLNNSGYSDLDVATNIFGTSGGVIAGSIYGSQKNIVPDFRNMLPGDVNKKLLEQNIKRIMAEPTPLESLQQKLDTNSLNPREYNTEQLSTIDNLIEQGVLKGPRMSDIVQNFNTTAETLAEEKEFAKDPLAVALKDKSIFQGELTGLIPTRPGAELVGDLTGSLLPYIRNKDVLVNSLKLPKAAQSKLFTQKAIELSRYLEKIPKIGKAFKFTRGILTGAGKAADAATSARLKPLIVTEAQSLAGGALGAGGGVQLLMI
jgi:hypothetical protein